MSQLKLQGQLNVQGKIHHGASGPPTLPKFGVDAAYSVRKLFNDYTGYAMRVRRSSDNAELDIGFTVFNLLDETSILNFCGNSLGTVVAWYDQSGNGYTAGVSNVAYSVGYPYICDGGAMFRLLGSSTIPAIYFAGNRGLITSTALPDFKFNSVFFVESHQYTSDSDNERIYDKRRSNGLVSLFRTTGINYSNYNYGRGGASSLSVDTAPSATFFGKPIIFDATKPTDVNVDIRVNNVLQVNTVIRTGAQQDNANFALGIGTNVINAPTPSGGNYFSGSISELIIYNSDMQAFRQPIINNINYYYQAF